MGSYGVVSGAAGGGVPAGAGPDQGYGGAISAAAMVAAATATATATASVVALQDRHDMSAQYGQVSYTYSLYLPHSV